MSTLEVLAAEIRHERELRLELAKRLDERNAADDEKFQMAIKAQKDAVDAAFDAAERAKEKADTAQQAHNLAANEWRATLNDHAKRQITRDEADVRFAALEDKIDAMTLGQANSVQARTVDALTQARSNAAWTRGAVLTVGVTLVGWIITVALVFLRSQ